ncbi:hypothetical protein GCM10009846_27290 [Agrococcus versicolor]|uniref:Uncharacterized protein n=1 Tax=Agrococcus versicolor TaxID=501482 RepID=A0ABN3AWW0_9MICO
MRTVPILAGGILLALSLGTVTAVAATAEPTTTTAVDRIVVEPAVMPQATSPQTAPVVVVTPAETSAPTLVRPSPAVASASEPAPQPEPQQVPVEPAPVADVGDTGSAGPHQEDGGVYAGHPAYVDARCTDVVPQSVTDAMWNDRGFTRYGIHFPVDWYFPWQGYPADELQTMAQHWLANCTWSDTVGGSGATLHVDFGAGLDAADIALLEQQSAAWESVALSTGDVLRIDASRAEQQFPAVRAYVLQGDRWMRIWAGNGADPVELAETLLASGLTWS